MEASDWEFAGSDDYIPGVFDPLGYDIPDYDAWQYDEELQSIIDENAQPIELSPQEISAATPLVEQGLSPLNTVINLRKQADEENAPSDPLDLMPEKAFKMVDDGIFFYDSSFAGPVLRSMQNTNQKGLQGWLILPASSVARIRTRKGNHGAITQVFWTPHIEGLTRETFK